MSLKVNGSTSKSSSIAKSRRGKEVAATKELEKKDETFRPAISPTEWVELFPHGISVSSSLGRPVLILKDKHAVEVLPVWMNPLDAGVALAHLSNSGAGNSPHLVTRQVLEMLEHKLEECRFIELKGHHLFVSLIFSCENGQKKVQVRADEAMSFCLQGHARFFSTRELMARCRNLDSDLTQFEQNIAQGQIPGLLAEMEKGSKKHPYVM